MQNGAVVYNDALCTLKFKQPMILRKDIMFEYAILSVQSLLILFI